MLFLKWVTLWENQWQENWIVSGDSQGNHQPAFPLFPYTPTPTHPHTHTHTHTHTHGGNGCVSGWIRAQGIKILGCHDFGDKLLNVVILFSHLESWWSVNSSSAAPHPSDNVRGLFVLCEKRRKGRSRASGVEIRDGRRHVPCGHRSVEAGSGEQGSPDSSPCGPGSGVFPQAAGWWVSWCPGSRPLRRSQPRRRDSWPSQAQTGSALGPPWPAVCREETRADGPGAQGELRGGDRPPHPGSGFPMPVHPKLLLDACWLSWPPALFVTYHLSLINPSYLFP